VMAPSRPVPKGPSPGQRHGATVRMSRVHLPDASRCAPSVLSDTPAGGARRVTSTELARPNPGTWTHVRSLRALGFVGIPASGRAHLDHARLAASRMCLCPGPSGPRISQGPPRTTGKSLFGDAPRPRVRTRCRST
jgi:hypothetical protein